MNMDKAAVKARIRAWAGWILLGGHIMAHAQVAVTYSDKVTLQSLTDYVYQHHPERFSEQARQQLAEANQTRADLLFAQPSTMELRHQNDVIGSGDGLQEWEAGVALPLWLPGQQQKQRKLTASLLAELPAYQRQTRWQASMIVREVVWHVVRANNAMQQALQVWQTAQKLQQDVAARVRAGELAATEQLLADTDVIDKHNMYLQAEAELEHALTHYHRYTGEYALPRQYEEQLDEQIIGAHHVTVSVPRQHPQLEVWAHTIETLKNQQEIAAFEGAVNPVVTVGMRRERATRSERYSQSVGISISLALDDAPYRKPAIAQAAKALAEAQVNQMRLERELNFTLLSRLHDLEAKKKQLELLNAQDEATQKYLALQRRAFELGEIDLVSLLRSQSLANESHSRKLAAELEIRYLVALVNQALGKSL